MDEGFFSAFGLLVILGLASLGTATIIAGLVNYGKPSELNRFCIQENIPLHKCIIKPAPKEGA